MIKRTYKLGSTALMVAVFGVTAVQADTITTYAKADYPSSAEVITIPSADATFGDDANVSLEQSFTVASAFDARRIFIPYENDPGGNVDWSMTVSIFAVADVFATDFVASGAAVYTGTFTFPAATPSAGTEITAQLDLTTAVPLAASVGSSGYVLQLKESSGADFNPGFEWLRTTTDNPYAGGNMYEDGLEKNTGLRDLSLAITSIPEPATLGLLSICAIGAFGIRRFRM